MVRRSFPADAVVNVKTAYGAKGDGVADDGPALQKAISENLGRILYLPDGTYLVHQRLEGRGTDGKFSGGMALHGQSRDQTVVRLSDGAEGFGDAATPRAVVYTASGLYVEDPYGGGKDYPGLGEGNEAFSNYVENLTIDAGTNAGAVALDYLGNNVGAVRGVTLRGQGPVGLAMTRKWPGPCLVQDVAVEGFGVGVAVAQEPYGVTIDTLRLTGQTEVGLRNDSNALSIHGLVSVNGVAAVQNVSSTGLVVLVEASLTGGASSLSAIDNQGGLFARDVQTCGYASALREGGQVVAGAAIDEHASHAPFTLFGDSPSTSLRLPIATAPTAAEDPTDEWESVLAHGAVRDDYGDDTDAIQAALSAGRSTVYFPPGRYYVHSTLTVPAGVRRVFGAGSTLATTYATFGDAASPESVLRLEGATSEPLVLERLSIGSLDTSLPKPGLIGVEQATGRPVVVRDVGCCGPATFRAAYHGADGTGPVFFENVTASRFLFDRAQSVWARQLDPEDDQVRLTNQAASVWILGLKTEGSGTIVHTSGTGATEVLGGALYVNGVPAGQTAFVNDEARVSLSFETITFADHDYTTLVSETRAGQTAGLAHDAAVPRGYGRHVPLYVGR